MASSRTADVNLVIRAKTEGERAISSMADAVAHLISGAGSGNQELAAFGRTIAALDKAAAGLSIAQERVSASAAKQAAAAHEASAGIAEQQARVEALRRGITILSAESDKAFIGPRRNGLADTLRLAKSELTDAERQLNRYTATLNRNLAALQTSRSGLLGLRQSSRDTAEAQAAAQQQIAATTVAMEQQARAAKANGAALAAINRSQPAPSGKSAADSASVFTRAGLTPVERDFNAAAAEASAQALRDAARAHELFEARVRAGAQALKEEESAAERDQATIQRLRDTLDPVAAVQRHLNTELERYQGLARAGKISTDELAAAEKHLKSEAAAATAALARRQESGKPGMFGLRGYELQNLGYQANDVVTQLASGTGVLRTIGQQGGQILQLFPRVGSALVSALTNPAVLGAVAVFGAIALALKESGDQAERLRNATADLGRRANGGDYTAGTTANQVRDLERLGATAEHARAAINTLHDFGVPEQSIASLGRVALETSQILGTDLPDAARQVATAFTGGYQAIAELDNRLNFLTGTQRDHIRQLFEEGHAQEGQTLALGIYSGKMDVAAAQMRGPWADATRQLDTSWHGLLDSLSNTRPIKAAHGFINGLSGAVSGLAHVIDDIASGGDLTQITANLAEIAAIRRGLADPSLNRNQLYLRSEVTGDSYTDAELRQRLARLVAETNTLAAANNQRRRLAPDGTLAPLARPAPTPTTAGDTPQARQRAEQIAALTNEERLQQLRDAGSQRLLTAAERAERTRLAGQLAFNQAQDAAVGDVQRRIAGEHEISAIQRETTTRQNANRAAQRQADQEREQTIRTYLQHIGAAEGGSGRNGAGSSAEGIGQFLRGTFVGVYRQANPGTRYTDDQIAGLRRDPATAAQILDIFTRQNAQFLTRLHATISGANLYLIHFLGQGTGRAVLQARGSTPVDQIIRRVDPNAETVLRQNRSYLYNRDGSAKTRDQLLSFLGTRVGDATGAAGSTASAVALQNGEAEREEQDRRRQAEFDLSVQQANEDRQRTIDNTRAQAGLHGAGLIDVQRVQAGTAAVQELQQRVDEINRGLPEGHALVTVTPEQISNVRGLAEAMFDVQHAQERVAAERDALQRPIDDLTDQRDLLRQQADLLDTMGDTRGAQHVRDQLDGLTPRIQAAYDTLIQFYRALSPDQRVQLGILDQQQLDNVIARLQQARDVAGELPRVLGQSGRTFLEAFSGAAANAFENFIKNVASGKNVFKSFAQGVAEFVSSFARSMAEAILKTLAFLAALEVLSAITHIPVAVLAQVASAGASVASHHTGGIVGQGTGQRRTVNPAIFAGAMRFHKGGVVGLAPDELPAILQRDEEVLTKNDPRHRNNGGLSTGGRDNAPAPINVINTFDPEEAAEMLLRTRAGERAFINFISANPNAVKAALR